MTTSTESPKEQMGEIENEKTFHSEKLGGSFTFRLPFVFDELEVLRQRTQIMGVPENMAGPELLALSHARAMFNVYNVHAPHGFKLEKQRSWAAFLALMTEVRSWHDEFFQSLGVEETTDSTSQG